MASYSYRAMDPSGRINDGKIDAMNLIDLEMRLRRMNLDLITSETVKASILQRKPSVTRRELILFCFHLDQLLAAGVPIIDSLADLRDSVEIGDFKQILASLLEDIEGGLGLSEAMASHPAAFDSVFIALIRTGEQAGQLPAVLRSLTENLKWQDELRAQVKQAMAYPIFAGVIILAAIFALMMFLVPELAKALPQLVPKLPIQTAIVIAVSNVFVKYWYLIIGIPIVSVIAIIALAKSSEAMRLRVDRIALRLPILGPLFLKIILARFSTFFALMYKSGIGVLDCIRISEKIVGNRVVEQGLQRVGQDINDGANISDAFTRISIFPPLVVRMLRVGENTGALDVALNNVSYFYNRDVQESVARLKERIQPALTVILGVMVITIFATVFSPLYDVISTVTQSVRAPGR